MKKLFYVILFLSFNVNAYDAEIKDKYGVITGYIDDSRILDKYGIMDRYIDDGEIKDKYGRTIGYIEINNKD